MAILADDFREAMVVADVLVTYEHLPRPHRERFSAWIEKASDEGTRWRRIQIFVLSLRMGPLQPDGAGTAGHGPPAQLG